MVALAKPDNRIIDTILHGDALASLQTLPSNYVQCCVTSPPYYGLRDYQVEGQIGLEETPEQYVNKLVEVFRQVKRVLRDDGVLWLNIGDSYASDVKGSGGDPSKGKQQGGALHMQHFTPHRIKHGLKPKNLLGMPWRVAFALQADGWILRSAVIWHKPNAMPESVKDRPTNDYEHVFMLAKNERYFYDAEAVKEDAIKGSANAGCRNYRPYALNGRIEAGQTEQSKDDRRNRRSVWSIATKPYSGAHFAVMPEKLVEPCVLASSRPSDIILDPFSGAGTVPLVALQQERRYIGIELNAEYITIAEKRLAQHRGLWEVG